MTDYLRRGQVGSRSINQALTEVSEQPVSAAAIAPLLAGVEPIPDSGAEIDDVVAAFNSLLAALKGEE